MENNGIFFGHVKDEEKSFQFITQVGYSSHRQLVLGWNITLGFVSGLLSLSLLRLL